MAHLSITRTAMFTAALSIRQEPLREVTDDCAEFGGTCTFSQACVATGYGKQELEALLCLVEHTQPRAEGEHLFRRGEPFRALYAVRTGSVKTSIYNRDGREQVLGFYLPGEVIGLNGIYPECYPCDAIALEGASVCRFSFTAMSDLAASMPTVQLHLFRLLSRELGMASMLAGDHTADERVAAFLLDLGERHALRGLSTTRFQVPMSRSDMASYLRLASETVSRVLTRFRARKWVEVVGRHMHLCDIDALRELGSALLQAPAAS